jgi:hypothetical protein
MFPLVHRIIIIVLICALAPAGCYRSYFRIAEDDALTDPEIPDFAIDPGTDEWVECHDRTFDVSRGRPDLLILLDRSNSMCPDVGPTYLGPAKNAIRDIVGTWGNQIAFGYTFFPSTLCVPMSSFLCTPTTDTLVPVQSGTGDDIIDALDDTDCCGGTPLAESLDFVRRYYDDLDDGHAHHLLLVTDGAPNCNSHLDRFSCVCTDSGTTDCERFDDALNCLDDARAVSAAAGLSDAGVTVHVLGLADAAVMWSRVMDDIAEAGGTDLAVLVEEPEAIAEAMDGIAGDVAPCRFTLVPGEVVDPEKVYFLVDGAAVPHDPGHADGWDWVNAWTVDFYGPTCDRIVAGGASVVTARINCDDP